jgi:hypothetical protein
MDAAVEADEDVVIGLEVEAGAVEEVGTPSS